MLCVCVGVMFVMCGFGGMLSCGGFVVVGDDATEGFVVFGMLIL